MAAPRKGSSGVFIFVVLVLVAALAVEGFILLRSKPTRRPAAAEAAIKSGSNEIETFGEKSAPIKVEFYAPLKLDWHQKTIGLLKDYDKAHPGTIFVTLMPMGRSDCDEAIQKRGVSCAVIFINGKNEFTLPNDKKVQLYQRPNQSTSTYKSEDVIAILDQMAPTTGR